MAAPRLVVELTIGEEDMTKLMAIARSRTETASRVERSRMLLAYQDDPSFFAVGRALGVHNQTVRRCVERAVAFGPLAALDDSPRPGKGATITPEAKTWLVSLACRKAKDLGYPHELWTTRWPAMRANTGRLAAMIAFPIWLRARFARSSAPRRSSPTRCVTILSAATPSLTPKWRKSSVFTKRWKSLRRPVAASAEPSGRQAIVSYDEKPGMQAIGATAPDLPPKPGVHAAFARDHEYKRHGTLSLLAGIDLVTGKVHGLVKERHRSREFIEFLKLLNAAYPASTAIKLILDNHSAHISKETKAWLATQPEGRFIFVFTPKHGSWLNLVEGFFSKLARSVLRHIRVASKQELEDRILAAIDDINQHPVVHTWSYKLDEASYFGNAELDRPARNSSRAGSGS